jgi:cytochrome c
VWIRGAVLSLLLALSAISCGDEPREPRFDALVFSRTTAFRHTEAIDAGRAELARMGEERDFSVDATEDPSRFSDDGLEQYEVVVLLSTNGPGVLRGAERAAFERWVGGGGGVVAIHAAANADRDWAWYGELLGGARFRNHPPGDMQFQRATVIVEDPDHPATAPLPREWARTDEWYNFDPEPGPAAHVLATLDERTYDEVDGSPQPDEHPIAWSTTVGRGRSVYTALGHGAESWSDPLYRAHVLGAVEWVAGE